MGETINGMKRERNVRMISTRRDFIKKMAVGGGAVVLLNDSDSDDDGPPIVTSVSPPEGTVIPSNSVITTITFSFSSNMTQAGITESNFVITTLDSWLVEPASLNWPDSHTAQVDVSTVNSATIDGFTITLSGFTDTGGTPLAGQTSFVFSD